MKKIEEKIIENARKMRKEQDGSVFKRHKRVLSSRDELQGASGSVVLYLHGVSVAWTSVLADGSLALTLHSRGFRTQTAKSRMNAMLAAFCCTGHIVQKNYRWYIRTDGKDEPFYDGMHVAVPVLEGEK